MPRGSLSLLNLSRCEVVKRKIMMTSSSIDGIRNKGLNSNALNGANTVKWTKDMDSGGRVCAKDYANISKAIQCANL